MLDKKNMPKKTGSISPGGMGGTKKINTDGILPKLGDMFAKRRTNTSILANLRQFLLKRILASETKRLAWCKQRSELHRAASFLSTSCFKHHERRTNVSIGEFAQVLGQTDFS